jgi:redox-sensitive bicupin YhaK (pirin superfamily)
MSGPVDVADIETSDDSKISRAPVAVVTDSRLAEIGSMQVRRALPTRGRRTVGAWCFADHFGPADVTNEQRPDIGPHPHIGLQTVTWLLAGELVHHDSLGSEQLIRPGQLNLMTAGHGVAHAEEATARYRGPVHGIQLWVAQPSSTRHGQAAFEHQPVLPRVELDNADATVLVGEFGGSSSPARRDSEHVGVDLALRAGRTTIPLDQSFEYAMLITSGSVTVDRDTIGPGQLLYLGAGRDELAMGAQETSEALLLGGTPFGEELLMWWNFVARTRDEVDTAYDDWAGPSGRFGPVATSLARIETSPPLWRRTTA